MKAIALFSGGLDSILAIKLIQEQNITVEAIYVDNGFESNKNKMQYLNDIAKEHGFKLHILDIKERFIREILFTPVYGYGKNINPCIDCHANMIRVAKEFMNKTDAKFIISGEVVGQRPMSQRLPALNAVNKLADANGLVLRPLSAKLLPPTIPEINGWVQREKFLSISGRDRKTQLELAKKYNLENFESPGGGCLLTDMNFAKRLKSFPKNHFTSEEIEILKVGRHFNVEGFKIIVSRNAGENPVIKNYKGDFFDKMFPDSIPGPAGLIEKNAPEKIKQLAADIMISYTKFDKGSVIINGKKYTGEKKDKSNFANFLI